MKRSICTVAVNLLVLSSTLLSQVQFPPSQRELNGYLLGEDAKPISEGFDSVMSQQKYADGWTDCAYSIDTAHSAYMVFGFADSSDDCLSIQITGTAGTEMHPFLGLRLGDAREKVYETLGPPTSERHLMTPHLEFLQYKGRNYSVELDSLGNLWSVRILGYRGFPDKPSDSLPNLVALIQSLQSNDPDVILEALAPDVELMVGDTVYTIEGSARALIKDPTSRFSQLLYSGSPSMASLDLSTVRAGILDPASVKENLFTPTYKFPQSSFVKDVVFVVHAGKWRIWEAHLSP